MVIVLNRSDKKLRLQTIVDIYCDTLSNIELIETFIIYVRWKNNTKVANWDYKIFFGAY